MKLSIAFRVDASLRIGTGHVMRCLTLADALTARGADCQFLCRAHDGNLIEFIHSKGYITHALSTLSGKDAGLSVSSLEAPETDLAHSHWLGATQREDIEACAVVLAVKRPDWLIVDHYALEATWERALAQYYHKLMVIDDLADRPHVCDLLLDQTIGRDVEDYRSLVPEGCHLLCGSQYSLLRPEFVILRPYSLQRRCQPVLREVMIAMGGVDQGNVTGQMLMALRNCPLPEECRITVVMGAIAPWQYEVQELAKDMPWPTRVLVGVADMAQLMANTDLAIGAAGSTSWERCCLGIPTIMVVLAKNQINVAQGLEQSGAAVLLNLGSSMEYQLKTLLNEFNSEPERLRNMAECAARAVDGTGINSVLALIES